MPSPAHRPFGLPLADRHTNTTFSAAHHLYGTSA